MSRHPDVLANPKTMRDNPAPVEVVQRDSDQARATPSQRIVMLVANEFVHDTRVYKQARSLQQWGCEVHVVAMARADLPAYQEFDGIHVHRLEARTARALRLMLCAAAWWWPRLLKVCTGSMPLDVRVSHPSAPRPRNPQRSASTDAALREAPTNAVGRTMTWRSGWTRRLKSHPRLLTIGRWCNQGLIGSRRFITSLIRVFAVRPIRWGKRRLVIAPMRGIKRMIPGIGSVLGLNYDMARRALALQPDVIQSHDLNTLPAGALVKRLAGTPLVYDSHELFLERNIAGRSRRRDKLMWAPIERFCIRRSDAVMSVADGICEHLSRQYGIAKPHLVRNVQPFEPPAPRSRLLSDELGIPHDVAVVIYPGAITINRGLEAMIDSSVHLRGAAYVVMGYARNPRYLDELRQRAVGLGVLGSKVFFRDAVPIEQVVRYTASADLGIVPTQNVCLSYFYEASNKIFHCLMAGVPLAMSDHPEKRLIVEQFGVGVLFDERIPESIAAAVNEALADRAAMARMREACLAAARVLNWEHEERTLRAVFEPLLARRSRRMLEVKLGPSGVSKTSAVAPELAVSPHDA